MTNRGVTASCWCVGQDGVAGAAESGVESQVSRLIVMATSHENLCQSYIGWCPFW
jgi:serine/threonine-protein kinase mTOR